jgi:RimJ/RimL family protein N-acetyltransferase
LGNELEIRVAFDLQPSIHDGLIRVEPLRVGDFEALYAVASDPLIWEQHPSKNRYQREVFAGYFESGIASGGALRVIDEAHGELIGCSRYYDLDEAQRKVSIGYTFLARKCWARGFNRALKQLMLDHAFKFVDRVIFQVGRDNWRSRKAMEKLGGVYIGEENVAYVPGEQASPNVVFKIDAADWIGTVARGAPAPGAGAR